MVRAGRHSSPGLAGKEVTDAILFASGKKMNRHKRRIKIADGTSKEAYVSFAARAAGAR